MANITEWCCLQTLTIYANEWFKLHPANMMEKERKVDIKNRIWGRMGQSVMLWQFANMFYEKKI